MFIFQIKFKERKIDNNKAEHDAAEKKLVEAMNKAGLDSDQAKLVKSVFSALIEKKIKPEEALFLSKTLFDKESTWTEFLFSRKKSVLELYDGFRKEEWVRFLDLVETFKKDPKFKESMKTFDERHGDEDKPLESASRYTATTLHTALKPVFSGGKQVYQAERLFEDDPFARQLEMAKEAFGKLAESMFKEIQPKSTSGVIN